jgi:hypothetical protein
MGDAEDAGDDGDCAAERDADLDPALGETVGKDDESREGEKPGKTTGDGEGHLATSLQID